MPCGCGGWRRRCPPCWEAARHGARLRAWSREGRCTRAAPTGSKVAGSQDCRRGRLGGGGGAHVPPLGMAPAWLVEVVAVAVASERHQKSRRADHPRCAGLMSHFTHLIISVCVLISCIHNLGLTIKPIKGPPQGVYACPHNGLPLVGLTSDVCVLHLSLSMTVVSPELERHSSSWKRRSRATGGAWRLVLGGRLSALAVGLRGRVERRV
jgi:hypothetical protein